MELLKQILSNMIEFLFNPIIYNSNFDVQLSNEILSLITIINKTTLQITPIKKLSMLLSLKGVLPILNESVFQQYIDEIIKLIQHNQLKTNPTIIIHIIEQLNDNDNNNNLRYVNTLYYFLDKMYNKHYNYFAELFDNKDNKTIILNAFVKEFKRRFPKIDVNINENSVKLYQIMLAIIIDIYEIDLYTYTFMENKYKQKKNDLNNFIRTNCDFCLFTLNGLFSCFCNVNRGTFSLKKLNDNEHNMQIELIYHNKKYKYKDTEIEPRVKSYMLRIKTDIIKIIFNYIISCLNNIEPNLNNNNNNKYKDNNYSPNELYKYIINFFKHINNINNKNKSLVNYLFTYYKLFNSLFEYALQTLENKMVLNDIFTLYSISLSLNIQKPFIFPLLIDINTNQEFQEMKDNLTIHIINNILSQISSTSNNNKLNSISFIHFGTLLSTINYYTINDLNSISLYMVTPPYPSFLEDIYAIINKNKLFSNTILFEIPFRKKHKIILEIYIELLVYLFVSYDNEEFKLWIYKLFKIENKFERFSELENNSKHQSNHLNEFNLPTVHKLHCSTIQYILVKYMIFLNLMENNNSLLINEINNVIKTCLKLLKSEFKNTTTLSDVANQYSTRHCSDDCELYNRVNVLKLNWSYNDKIKYDIKKAIHDLLEKEEKYRNPYLLSICDVRINQYKNALQVNSKKTNTHQQCVALINYLNEDEDCIYENKEPISYESVKVFQYEKNFNDCNNIVSKFKNEILLAKFALMFKQYYFYNKDFISLKNNFLITFKRDNVTDKHNTFPSKLKNFSYEYNPPLFLKQDFSFFDNELLPISHDYISNNINNSRNKLIIYKKCKQWSDNDLKNSRTYYCELINKESPIFGFIKTTPHFMIFKQTDNFQKLLSQDETYNTDDKFLFYNIYPSLKKPEEKLKCIIIYHSQIKEIISRNFLHIEQCIEIYLHNGKSYLFNLLHSSFYKTFITKELNQIKVINISLCKDHALKSSEKWKQGKLSTFNYLLHLNALASRTYNDLNQYPVFPWCEITNDDNKINRNFYYPMTCQNAQGQRLALEKYDAIDEFEEEFQNHFGTHYSVSSYVYYYLMRMSPHLYNSILLQNKTLDSPNRMFLRFNEPQKIIKQGSDNRELIPELYVSVDCLLNLNYAYLGRRTDKILINDFCNENSSDDNLSNVVKSIIWHRNVLESNDVKSNIDKWINWIFGVDQFKENKSERRLRCNIFHEHSYSKLINLEKKYKEYHIQHQGNKNCIQKIMKNPIYIILNFGVTPVQLFYKEHSKAIIYRNDSKYRRKYDNQTMLINNRDSNKTIYYLQLHNDIQNSLKFLIIFYYPKQEFSYCNYINVYSFKPDKSKIELQFSTVYRNIPPTHQIQSKYTFNIIYNNRILLTHILDCSNSLTIELYYLLNKKKNIYEQFNFKQKLTSIASSTTFNNSDCITLYIGFQNGIINVFKFNYNTFTLSLINSFIAHYHSVDYITINHYHSLLVTSSNKEKEIYIRKAYDFELITIITMKRNYIINEIFCYKLGLYYIWGQDVVDNHKEVLLGYTLNGVPFSETITNSKLISMKVTSNGKVIVITKNEITLYHGSDLQNCLANVPIDLLMNRKNIFVFVDEDTLYNYFHIYKIVNNDTISLCKLNRDFTDNFEQNQHYMCEKN